MRYTTIIDITEINNTWRNPHAAMLYLYMCLKCGYHDDDRDIITISLRDISWRLHLSFSAARHAVKTLISSGLLQQVGTSQYKVVKYCEPKTISSTASAAKSRSLEEEARRTGKTVLMVTWERTYKLAYSNKGTEEQREWITRYAPQYRKEREEWEQTHQ